MEQNAAAIAGRRGAARDRACLRATIGTHHNLHGAARSYTPFAFVPLVLVGCVKQLPIARNIEWPTTKYRHRQY
jgi:hypothetical protein